LNFDITEIIGQQGQNPEQPTREEYAEQKRVEKVLCDQMRKLALTHVFSGGEPFTRFLDLQARLGKMSAGNTLLILAQRPDATDVRSFDEWKEVSRSVKADETGLLIIKAHSYEARDESADGGNAVQRTGFGVRRRFDVSQTHGRPLMPPEPAPFDPVQRIRALAMNPPVRIVESEQKMDTAAHYNERERVIFVSKGFDAERTFVDMAVAVAEASFHPEARHAGTKLTAFCAGYIVCKRAGMEELRKYERFQFDPSYIPEENRMETISDAAHLASALQARMERNMQRMERRGQPHQTQAKQAAGQSSRQAHGAGGR
jgi:hypothetical protein